MGGEHKLASFSILMVVFPLELFEFGLVVNFILYVSGKTCDTYLCVRICALCNIHSLCFR